jgi:hypothetical protein
VKLITGVDRLVRHQLSTGKFSFSGWTFPYSRAELFRN